MSDATSPSVLDPAAVRDRADFAGARLDRSRVIAIPDADADAIARAIVALVNTRGGDILVGVCAGDDGVVSDVPGVSPEALDAAVADAVARVDPPVSHLVHARTAAAANGVAGIVHARVSPSTPHLCTVDGGIYRATERGVTPLRSRRALDDLYARGRGERERADRLVDAMIEKLSLSHYAFYSLAVVACTHAPSGEPFRAALADTAWLAPEADPFVAGFGLHEQQPSAGPGEIELRTPGDVNAYLRVTRGGCVAAGEVQRRPYHDELDTVANLETRITALCATVSRILSVSSDALMLPQLFIEGVRGLRLVQDPAKRIVSANAPQDTTRIPLSVGDARDAAYVARLPREAMERLGGLFPGLPSRESGE